MKHYRITMKEDKGGEIRTLIQEALAENRAQVIEFYGLNEPDIVSYRIEEL